MTIPMRRLNCQMIGVDQGSDVLFSDFEDGGEMWTGSGPRALTKSVKFDVPFQRCPAIQISLSMWDMDQKTNQRADISAENISAVGFDIVFKTWGDTRVARVRADWMAIGELPNEDDWDVD